MKRFLLTLVASVCMLSLWGQTLEECRRLAREHYPQIGEYDLISRTEQYNLSNAARAWIPQLTFSGQASYQSATPTYPELFEAILQANGVNMAGISKDQYKVAVDLSQHIWDGGQSKANKAMAQAEAAEQSRSVDVPLYELQTRVDNLYFGILLLGERMEQTLSLIGVLESNLARMQSYCKNGVAMQADADAVEAELLSARQMLAQIESSKASYCRMLEIFIGKPLKLEQMKRPVMPELASRTPARPELALFDAQKERLDAQRKGVNSLVMPKFSAFARGYYGYYIHDYM